MYVIFFLVSFFFLNALWTTGLNGWLVDFLTGLAQLGIWITLLSLVPFSSLWVSAKTRNTAELTQQVYHRSLFSK